LFLELERAPDVVVIPTAYGDRLAGIERGFADLRALGLIESLPKLVAAEPFGPYAHALNKGLETTEPVPAESSVAFSTATPIGTYQGLAALRRTGGSAVMISDDCTILDAQRSIARREGLFVEAAAAVNIPVIARLVGEGIIGAEDTVVAINTSTGLKDIEAPAPLLPAVPVVEPSLGALDEALEGIRN
jgi:threonine synthase